MTIASIHCVYSRRHGQAKLAWVSGLNIRNSHADADYFKCIGCMGIIISSQFGRYV